MKNGTSQTTTSAVETVSNREAIKRLSSFEYAFHFMKKYEGLRLEAYHDGGRQWSIGYGTHSYPGEVITKDEAYRRYSEAIHPRNKKVKDDYPNHNTCQQGALVSLLYNCPSCYRNLQKYGISKNLRLKHSNVCVDGKCKRWRGLHNRRVAERELYSMCDNDL